MRALFLRRGEVQRVSGPLASTIDDLVSAINTPPVSVGDARLHSGTGSPEGRILGSPGDLYLRTDGSTSTTLYVKELNRNSKTGWKAK